MKFQKGQKRPLNAHSFEKGHKPWNTDKKLSEEHIRKLKEAKQKDKHPMWGKHFSDKVKRKMSESHNGQIPWNKGKKNVYSELILKKMGRKGERCNFWKGGIYQNPYPEIWKEKLKESIRQRDDYICQICEIHQDELEGRVKKLAVHHIDYNKENCDPKNLITLCRKCHIPTNFNREEWIKYFLN